MSTSSKQEQVYQISRALSQLPGAYQTRITCVSVTEKMRPMRASATEYMKFFPADTVPNDITIPPDAMNGLISFWGRRAAVPSGMDLGEVFAEQCRAQGMTQVPDAQIEVRDDGQPDAAYTIQIPLWQAK
jgi:hypothetical protein